MVEWYVPRSGLLKGCGVLNHNLARLLVGNVARQMSLGYSPRGPIALWGSPIRGISSNAGLQSC
jgi:hypothetical protein